MTDPIEKTFYRLNTQLSGGLSKPSDDRYVAATAIWAKPVGCMPRAITAGHLKMSSPQFELRANATFRCPCAAEVTTLPAARCATVSLSIRAA
jgi:hypothetical protein